MWVATENVPESPTTGSIICWYHFQKRTKYCESGEVKDRLQSGKARRTALKEGHFLAFASLKNHRLSSRGRGDFSTLFNPHISCVAFLAWTALGQNAQGL